MPTGPSNWRSRLPGLACAAALASALLAGVAGAATVRVSVTDAEGQAFGSFSAISGDGRYVAFNSSSTAFVSTTFDETYLRDVLAGTTTWVSSHPASMTVNISAYGFAVSQNGRIVAFGSAAPTLDANGFADVFVKNLDTSVLTRVSTAAPGQPENGDSLQPAISSDGRYVAFVSVANLLPADTNAARDVYLRDTQTGTLYLISVAFDGAQPNAGCSNVRPSVSDDGCLVAFSCDASNLVPADGNGSTDVFVRNRCAGTIERVSVASDGTERNAVSGAFGAPVISADGRYVAFYSGASFDPTDPGSNDIYVRDRQLGQTQRVSFAIGGGTAVTEQQIAMSRDGRFVAYSSLSANIVPNDMNNGVDVFVYDRTNGTTTRRSVANDGLERTGSSRNPSISDDGTFVAFDSTAALVPEDSNGITDVYRHQLDAVCGNGVVEPGEACDDGNTANGDCCSAGCQYESSATVCRPSAGPCDLAESCTGSSGTCPADAKVSSGTVCRSAAGVCDVAETCNGSSATCPSDGFASSATVCRSAAGVCDVAETCTGASAACPADAKVSSGTVCRSAAGVCDVAETCNGSSATCPSDGFASSAAVCRSAAGVCDVPETCTGASASCPADVFQPSSTVCRPLAGVCDDAESCTGSSASCPADLFKSSGTLCRASAGVCDVAESCTGGSASCPADVFLPSATVCRPSAGVCDDAESCTGSSGACPPDGFKSAATVCRPSAGECDLAETCTGVAAGCPSDIVKGSATPCTDDGNACTLDQCDGASVTCVHTSNPACACGNGTVEPDNNEECDAGAANGAPTSCCTVTCQLRAAGQICRTSAGICDVAETCTGNSPSCPADVFEPSTTTCRPAAGECDLAERCTGSGAACPGDVLKGGGTPCTDDGNTCTLDQCTGASVTCAHPSNPACACGNGTVEPDNNEECDAGAANGAPTSCCTVACKLRAAGETCRVIAGVCDEPEACTGSSPTCPADGFLPSATVCRPAAGVCDVAESCSGAAAACPPDGFLPSTTTCRPAAGVCDSPESCTGTAAACPADAFQPSTTTCRSAAGECDLAELCTGTGAACPSDAVKGSGTACTDDGNLCTLDQCDGTGVTCAHTSNPACACGNGTVEPDNGEQCDGGATNGAATSCCTAACQLRAAGQTCRTSAGICDVAETCTGTSPLCPADAFLPSTMECRPAAGVCDSAETCTGTSATCPADVLRPSTTICRAAAGVCDVAESCTGTDAACPADVVKASDVACPDDGNACTLDQCDGTSVTCGHPADPTCKCGNGTVETDNHEECDAGPANGRPTSCCTLTCTFRAAGQACRPSAGECDVAETCSGSAAACPADVKAPDGATCTDGIFCNGTDTCAGGTCSAHAGNPCPGPDGDGDCAETCSEAAKACTAPDPDGSVCSDSDQCTVGDVCTAGACTSGTPVSCPADQLCNPSTGICGPSATCAASCDDDNPCTTDTCDPSQGKCVSVPVADGQACEDADECTSGTPMCAAGTCGVRDCQVEATQVTENGVPEPAVDATCQLFARKRNGAARKGTCSVQLVDATGSAALTNALPLRRRAPRATVLSKLVRAPIKNGRALLRLVLNKRGKQLLGESPDGVLVVEVRTTVSAKGTRARIQKILALRR